MVTHDRTDEELLKSLILYLAGLPPRIRRPLIRYLFGRADEWLDRHTASYGRRVPA